MSKRNKPTIPDDVLKRLKVSNRFQNIDSSAMWQVAKILGWKSNEDYWNHCIDYLDSHYPGWRGYSVPTERQMGGDRYAA